MEKNELELIARARKGDRDAFQRLLEGYYDMIYRVAYRFTGLKTDAEDIAQDVCVGLVDKLKGFKGESSVSTWLYRIVVNACNDFHRKNKSHRTLDERYTELGAQERAGDADNAKMLGWLYRQIATLSDDMKETALLVLGEQLSHAEAGKVLGIKEATVSWRMHEIRKELKARMDSYEG
jgi:RNA polymerase sigma-70 factor, ECF subfamily